MRLSKRVLKILEDNIKKSFGNVDVYLFGSRVDDTKRGGDIDLAIDSNLPREQFRKNRATFLANLIRIDFDYSVDIVDFNTNDKLLYNEIRQNCIKIIIKS